MYSWVELFIRRTLGKLKLFETGSIVCSSAVETNIDSYSKADVETMTCP